MKKLLFPMMICLGLSACGSDSDSDNATPTVTAKTDVNVAASSNGAVATATYNSATATNINDSSDTTTWISSPEVPLIIKFATLENINKITVNKVLASSTSGTSPDILVELSVDGNTYFRSGITSFSSGYIPCTSLMTGGEVFECIMNEYSAQYIKITSKNGKSFEFKEVLVNSFK